MNSPLFLCFFVFLFLCIFFRMLIAHDEWLCSLDMFRCLNHEDAIKLFQGNGRVRVEEEEEKKNIEMKKKREEIASEE